MRVEYLFSISFSNSGFKSETIMGGSSPAVAPVTIPINWPHKSKTDPPLKSSDIAVWEENTWVSIPVRFDREDWYDALMVL